jgi:glycosyltransferase involved in cell wall biosynthesis
VTPRVSVIVPVHNRTAELSRALASVKRQMFEDFECIVVDDASSILIEPFVTELDDERFRYVRRESNGGPYAARVTAYREVEGEFVVGLDSDHEAYPWMLSRMVAHFDRVPEADGVAGMFIGASDGTQLVVVEGGTKLMTPAEYVNEPPVPDCVGGVRRFVIGEWLQKRDDYFALEAQQWFTFHMRHAQLFVDEPWARMYTDAASRVSQTTNERVLDDYAKFLDEHAADLLETRAVVLDRLVAEAWFKSKRAGRDEQAERFAELMAARGLSRWQTVATRLAAKAKRSAGLPAAGTPYRLR